MVMEQSESPPSSPHVGNVGRALDAGESRYSRTVALARLHKQELLLTLVYCISFVGLGISITGLGPTLLELVDFTHSTKKQMGYIFTVKGCGYLIGSMSGRLFDRFDGHKILFVDILVASVCFVIVPFVSNIWGQGFVWFIAGIFTGGMDTGVNTLIVWVWKEKVSPFMQLLHFSFGLGAFLSPIVLNSLHERSLFVQYLALAVPCAVSAFPLLFLRSPSNTSVEEVELDVIAESPIPNQNMKEKLLSDQKIVMEEIEEDSIESLDKDSSAIVEKGTDMAYLGNLASTTVNRLRIEIVIFASLLLFLDVGAEIGYGGWLYTYAVAQLNFSEDAAGYVNAAFWGSFMTGRLAAVGIATVLSPKAMLFADTIGCSLSLIVLIIFPDSPTALWVCSIVFGLSIASVFPTVISLPQHLGIPVTGTDTSWMVVGASAGEMLVPFLVGQLQEKYSMLVLIAVILIVEVLGGFTFGLMLLRAKYVKGELDSVLTWCGRATSSSSDKNATSSFRKLNEQDT